LEVTKVYLIAMQKGGYQAIPIRVGDKWDFSKLLIGKREVRIILRVRGRRYLLYHTRDLAAKYPDLKMSQMTILCDEIIAATSDRIASGQKYIEFERLAAAAECRNQRRWRELGLISPATPEQYHGHPIDGKAEQLVSYVQVTLDDIVVMDCEPPVDCEQAELPY
jgi:hypothetical protein